MVKRVFFFFRKKKIHEDKKNEEKKKDHSKILKARNQADKLQLI